jgi:hypothetical protein
MEMIKKGLFVTNETATTENFTVVNLKANKAANTRYDTMEGKQYLVVPCVMLTEGVHEGSRGPLYYPADELSKFPVIWNGKPVVVYHPELNGISVSACDPDIYTSRKIGVLMNTKWEDGKLKTECWLEEDKIKEVDERVLNAIQSGEMMEVSTGLFFDPEVTEGVWNGEKYTAIARNYRPDHLAILPDLEGACSIEDGAGLLRNAAEQGGPIGHLAQSLVSIFNELSHSEIWRMLSDKIQGEGTNTWVSEVFDNFFIYEQSDKTYYQEYSIKDNEVTLVGMRKEAEKITQYKLSDGTFVGNTVSKVKDISEFLKEKNMNKEKIVNDLIKNEKSPWTEGEREYLMEMTEDQLTCIVNSTKEKDEDNEDKKSKKVPAANNVVAVPIANAADEPKPMTAGEYIANAPKEVQDMYYFGMATLNKQKTGLIEKIKANPRNPFTEEQLKAKDIGELGCLAKLAEVPEAPKAPAESFLNFGGLGEVINQQQESGEEDPLVAPAVVLAEE